MGRTGRYFRTAANALLIIILVLAGLLAALFLLANRPAGGGRAEDIPGIGRYKVLVVLSDSMRPAFAAGDLVVIDTAAAEDEIKQGDIIAFRGSGKPGVPLVHRVAGTEEINGETFFYTRGDAGSTAAGELVRPPDVLGCYLFKVPYGGYLTRLVHTRAGFFMLVILPAVLAFLLEVKLLKRKDLKERLPWLERS
ncbi:MAG: signal peptidase I [Bacillota bacterium]